MNSKTIEELRILVEKGALAEFSRALDVALSQRLDRKYISEIASLARRGGVPFVALRLLNPIVRPKNGVVFEATDKEKTVYAAALLRIGGVEEAMRLLKSVDEVKNPDALLFLGHAHMSQWNYTAAIPLLQRFLALSDLSLRDAVVGNINLAACFVSLREFQEAALILNRLMKNPSMQTLPVFLGLAHLLLAQLAIGTTDFSTARKELAFGKKTFPDDSSLESLLIEKWYLYCDLFQQKDFQKHKNKWEKIKDLAMSFQHWETLRDLDFMKAIVTGDTSLASRLYYGTPFAEFRKKIVSNFPVELDFSKTFTFAEVDNPDKVYQLFSKEVKPHLNPAHLNYRLTYTFFSDFYRPFTVGSIFEILYPKQFFNPASSIDRVQQAIRGLKNWCAKSKVVIDFRNVLGTYRVDPLTSGFVIPHPFHFKQLTNPFNELKNLRTEYFSKRDIQKELKITQNQAHRIVSQALEEGVLGSVGARSGTLYYLLTKSSLKKASGE